ncbi:MAG: alpha/beta fold hydrolase [Pseudomonadota bacterium]
MTPLFACHGIGLDGRFFDRQRPALAPRQVISVDMPGFGGQALDGPTDFPMLTERLSDAIGDHAPAPVIGHSMGGMVALELAATRPDRISALILCNTTSAFGGRDDTFKQQFVSARLAPLDAGKTMADIAPAAMRATCGADVSEDDVAFLAGLMAEAPEAAYRAAIDCLVTFDRREALAGLAIPSLLIGGEDDQAAPARTMQRMAEKIVHARCHILPGGHMTPVEQTHAVNDLIRDFLEEVER